MAYTYDTTVHIVVPIAKRLLMSPKGVAGALSLAAVARSLRCNRSRWASQYWCATDLVRRQQKGWRANHISKSSVPANRLKQQQNNTRIDEGLLATQFGKPTRLLDPIFFGAILAPHSPPLPLQQHKPHPAVAARSLVPCLYSHNVLSTRT